MKKLRAFTLIELLIVVVILGILATVTITAINPVEQIRKTQDTGHKNDAESLLSAVERYYSSYQGAYPWEADTNCAAPASDGTSGVDACWLTILQSSGEVKSQFAARSSLNDMQVTLDASSNVHVCFAPVSQAYLDQAVFDASGQTANPGTHVCVPE